MKLLDELRSLGFHLNVWNDFDRGKMVRIWLHGKYIETMYYQEHSNTWVTNLHNFKLTKEYFKELL